MPKKKQIKLDEGVTLASEQAAEVLKQMYEGSYGLGAPEIAVTDDDITVRVASTVYTAYGDSPLLTTTVLRRSEQSYTPAALSGDDVGYAVRDAIERARDAADGAIKAINEEWAANVGEFDEFDESNDGDEGLREGPVVGSGPYPGFTSRSDAEASDTSPEGLARRIAYADDLVRSLDAAEAERDLITLPNVEYAELLATARRDAAFRAAFTGVVATDDSEVDLEALNAAFAGIPAGPYDVIKHTAGWEVRQLDTDPTNGHHWPVRLCQGIAGQKAAFDDAAANFLAGVLNAWPLIAARLAATDSNAASDSSDAGLDDGGPVEPELDIDALVAAADLQRDTSSLDIRAVRSAEYPHLTVTVTGPGSADLVRQIISDIHLPGMTEPLVVARPVEDDGGEFSRTAVDPVAHAEAFRRVVRARI